MTRLAFLLLCAGGASLAADPVRVLIIVGPSQHPPGTHEVAAGGRLLQHTLEHMQNVQGVKADVVYEWPQDKALLERASTIVFLGDTFPVHRLPDAQKTLAELGALMDRGKGIVCLHYATGLRGEDVAEGGDHPLLRWMGGYFAHESNRHHQSIARVFEAAEVRPANPSHPVSKGWKPFVVHDEPYIRNYLSPAAVPLAVSALPPEDPRPETVAWAIERRDGGRGFAIVMPHFYKNWAHEDLRRLILNGIVWTATGATPRGGVRTAAPDLAQFSPASVNVKK